MAVSDVDRRVDVCVVLRYPTLVVLTPELIAVPIPDVAALVARLARVLRANVFDRDASLSCFVLDTLLQASERPCVEASVHPFAVVEVFADVREVFQNDHRLLESAGVLDCLPRRLFDDVCECVLVVVESLVNPPLGGVTLLQSLQRCEHLFAEVTSAAAVDEQWVSRSALLAHSPRAGASPISKPTGVTSSSVGS
uniref:URF 2 n=1 Tax=Halobacterium phage phiH TaxID=169684 RepID=Q38468_BPPHH|nr:unnamed protein product [Halobacterium phage phiH]